MTREEVIKLVQDSDLSDANKSTWIASITEKGLTREVLDGLKSAFQSEIDAGYEKLGIDITGTPEYKEKEAAMVAKVEAIKANFDDKMAQSSKQLTDLQADAGKALDTLKAEEVKAKME